MAGSFMSTLMMFFPQQTQWVCIIGLCIFVFGIYIPWEEHKKKKKKAKKTPPKEQKTYTAAEPSGDRKQVEQLKALRDAGILTEEEYQERKQKIRQP